MQNQSRGLTVSTQQLIDHYQLKSHIEGGYYRRIYSSDFKYDDRHRTMSSIYYCVQSSAPYTMWHVNISDIIHFHLKGGSLAYDLIDQQGKHTRHTLGQDFINGESLHLIVKSGIIKSTTLLNGDYGLLTQVVTPGFQQEDCKLFSQQQMCQKFPHLTNAIRRTQFKNQNQIHKYKQSQQENSLNQFE